MQKDRPVGAVLSFAPERILTQRGPQCSVGTANLSRPNRALFDLPFATLNHFIDPLDLGVDPADHFYDVILFCLERFSATL